jgi:hypothetical protein
MRDIGWRASAAVLAVVALGCAAPGREAGDGSSVGLSPSPSPPASPAGRPPAGGTPQGGPPGDGPPNYADNNGWKQRHELTAAEQRTGQELAGRIRPELAALRAAGDFRPDSTRRALLGLGIAADSVQVTPMRTPLDAATPPPGAVYAVRFPDAGCVIGDVRPDRVLVEVTGAGGEFGCLEPYTH